MYCLHALSNTESANYRKVATKMYFRRKKTSPNPRKTISYSEGYNFSFPLHVWGFFWVKHISSLVNNNASYRTFFFFFLLLVYIYFRKTAKVPMFCWRHSFESSTDLKDKLFNLTFPVTKKSKSHKTDRTHLGNVRTLPPQATWKNSRIWPRKHASVLHVIALNLSLRKGRKNKSSVTTGNIWGWIISPQLQSTWLSNHCTLIFRETIIQVVLLPGDSKLHLKINEE